MSLSIYKDALLSNQQGNYRKTQSVVLYNPICTVLTFVEWMENKLHYMTYYYIT